MESFRPLRRSIAIIGMGRRGLHTALGRICENPLFYLAAVCDPDEEVLRHVQDSHPNVLAFARVDKLIEYNKKGTNKGICCAYVSVPHSQYVNVVPALLRERIHVLKEKPAGATSSELQIYQDLADRCGTRLVTASQSRYGSWWSQLEQLLPLIGDLHLIEGTRKIAVLDLTEGWRASKALAGGGAVNDVGWHLIDTVLLIVGAGYEVFVPYSRLFKTQTSYDYDCEDSAHIVIEFRQLSGKHIIGSNLRISRSGLDKVNEITILGSTGTIVARDDEIRLLLHEKRSHRSFKLTNSNHEDFDRMLHQFHSEITFDTPSERYLGFCLQDAQVTKTIDTIYFGDTCTIPAPALRGTKPRLTGGGDSSLNRPLQWPRITADVEEETVAQLHRTISIYDNGGIFHEFETEFKEFHGRPEWHAVVHNSGTNALQALYYACQLLPGDEVIFPVYTFHATCSPAMHFGIQPVFCDASTDGNISPAAIARAITPRSKAVVITHMWGLPCNMIEITSVLRKTPHILLLEDCSHALGASIQGQKVGTFGNGAAWSLQGQKIVSGGEGGIALTNNADFHYRQLIWGHYNKRCKIEVPKGHVLRDYVLTGTGLKNRAHPLAVAIALNQLRKMKEFQRVKNLFSDRLCDGLTSIPFLEPINTRALRECFVQHSWYAFIFRFKQDRAPPGLTRSTFVQELLDCGLKDIDIPNSTCLLHQEPLFTHPQTVLPHVTFNPSQDRQEPAPEYRNAQTFHDEVVKLPVWAFEDEAMLVEFYVDKICAVARRWMSRERL